jgi:hypothetical protein
MGVTGLEPVTSCLSSKRSTTELNPRFQHHSDRSNNYLFSDCLCEHNIGFTIDANPRFLRSCTSGNNRPELKFLAHRSNPLTGVETLAQSS